MIQVKVQVIGDLSLSSLSAHVDQVITKLVPDIQSEIARRTPIKSGQARRGWNTRKAVVENKVPYIERLEAGYSRQAPNGFVRQGITAAINKIGKV